MTLARPLLALGAWSVLLAALTPVPPSIAVLPVGDVPRDEVARLLPVLRDRFGREVVIGPALPLPAPAYDGRRRQYSSSVVLDALARARRPEWERVLGVADVDLYVPDLNFVFGEGDPQRGVAVFSLRRLRAGTDEARRRERAATEAVHELGHAYGLRHCSSPRCVMWFSSTLADSDAKGSAFCPAHTAELAARPR
jgi:archaemetzincin